MWSPSVSLADLVIVTRDGQCHVVRDGGLRAVSEADFAVEYLDGRATGKQLIQSAGSVQFAMRQNMPTTFVIV